MGTRFVHDPREDQRLSGLDFDAARERRQLSNLHIIGHAFAIVECAMLAPNLTRFVCNAAIGWQVFLRNGYDETIDILHLAHRKQYKPIPRLNASVAG